MGKVYACKKYGSLIGPGGRKDGESERMILCFTCDHLVRHDDDRARRRARILSRDAARPPPARPASPENKGFSAPGGTRGECTLRSTRPINLTAVPTARHSLGVWTVLCPLRALHDPIRVAGCQNCTRKSPNSRQFSRGFLQEMTSY